MYEVPSFVRREVGKIGRHRRAIKTSHEDSVEVLVCLATLKAFSCGEVIGHDALLFAVSQGRSRWPIALPLFAMTLPALHLLVQFVATVRTLVGYSFTVLNPNKDGPSDEVQRK